MRDHAVFGADGQTVDVPFAGHGFPGHGVGEASAGTQVFHEARHLCDGGDVAEENASGSQGVRHCFQVFPGSQHVENNAIQASFVQGHQVIRGVSYAHVPRGVTATEPEINIGLGNLGKVLTTFHGDQ